MRHKIENKFNIFKEIKERIINRRKESLSQWWKRSRFERKNENENKVKDMKTQWINKTILDTAVNN